MVVSRIFGTIFKGTLEIIPSVYQLTIRGANIVLIDEEELTLVDAGPPGSSSQIRGFIGSLRRSVEEISLIILTHSHFDHAGGLAELRKLTKAKVAAHQANVTDAESQAGNPGVRRKLPLIPLSSAFRSVFSVKLGEVDIQLAGGEVLKPLGGLKVIPTPGHTPDSISLFSHQNKLLIVGDALNKRRQTLRLPPKLVSTDLRQAIDSVKGIARLDADILCLGHGWPLTENVSSKMQELIEKVKD